MKSDREFLDGVFAKAEELASNSDLEHEPKLEQNYIKSVQKRHTSPIKYTKYAGMAAGFLLLIASGLFLNNLKDKNNQTDSTPIPRNLRMFSYTDQLLEQATDIVAINANGNKDAVALNIIKNYRSSNDEQWILNHLDNTVIGLTAGQSAIVFINEDSKSTPVMDIFILDTDNGSFINHHGEIITEELFNNLE